MSRAVETMCGRVAVVAGFLLVAVACGGAEPAPEIDPGTPEQSVVDWLGALDALDLGGLARSTDATRLALMAGAENELTNAQLYAVIDAGLPGPTAQSYWSSFRSSFMTFLGSAIAEIEVGTVERFDIGEVAYAVVTIVQGEARAAVITVLTDEGWRVDLVGTSGVALASQLTELVTRLVETASGDDAEPAARYRSAAIGSLRAALELRQGDRALQLEIDAIESLPRPTA